VQISTLSPSSLWSSLTTPQRQANPAPADAAPLAVDDAAVPLPAPASDVVSLQSDGAAPAPVTSGLSRPPPEIFAEIWKDGMKIGVVYTDGQAILPNSGGATAGNGAMPAYMRAQQISQEVGGEVRLVNIPALQVAQTRVQLQAAYGLRG
jgi:hypothetical protein